MKQLIVLCCAALLSQAAFANKLLRLIRSQKCARVYGAFHAALIVFLYGCSAPPPIPYPTMPIELNFHPLVYEEAKFFYQNTKIPDIVNFWPMQESIIAMSIKNNNYDTLHIYVAKFGENLVYRSDVCNAYVIEQDSLIMKYSEIRCFFGADSVLHLLKGQSVNCYFEGNCPIEEAIYEYNFSFRADSLGQKKFPQFMQFPCGNALPKK